jgi:hypothetical protein
MVCPFHCVRLTCTVYNCPGRSHDPVRQAKHSEKMRSKDERPKKQMQILGVDAGLVEHIAC